MDIIDKIINISKNCVFSLFITNKENDNKDNKESNSKMDCKQSEDHINGEHLSK